MQPSLPMPIPTLVPMPVENRPLVPPALMAAPGNLIFFGIASAIAGILLEAVGYAIILIESQQTQQFGNSRLLVDILMASQTAGLALVGIGMFLIFFGASRLRPASKPWTVAAAIVLLLTGVAAAILRASFYLILSGVLDVPVGMDTITGVEITSESSYVVGLAGSLALIAGLFGLTRS